MAYKVTTADCINCGACDSECPVECISEVNGARSIAADDCIDCGACADTCPTDCIIQA